MKLMELKVRRVGVDTAVEEVVKITQQGKPLMVMMIGLPASGKSSFVVKLDDALKEIGEDMFEIASTDNMVDEFAKNLGMTYSQAMFKAPRDEFEKKFKQTITAAVANQKSFIVDRTNVSKKKRQAHFQAVHKTDFVKVGIVFQIDEKTLTARLKARAEATGKHIPDSVMDQMKKDYEQPAPEEGFDTLIFIS